MTRPHQTPPRRLSRRIVATQRAPEALDGLDNVVVQRAEVVRVLLEPAHAAQPRLRLRIVICAEVALRAPLQHDEDETHAHDEARQPGAEAPVVRYPLRAVVVVVFEVDVAAIWAPRLRFDESSIGRGGTGGFLPDRCHAVAVLVRAEDLREDNVAKPARISDFEQAQHELLEAVAVRHTAPPAQAAVDEVAEYLAVVTRIRASKTLIEGRVDFGDDVRLRFGVGREAPPDQGLEAEGAERDDVEDDVAAGATAKANGWGEVGEQEGAEARAGDDNEGAKDLPAFAGVEGTQAVKVAGAVDEENAGAVGVVEPVAAIVGYERPFHAGEDGAGRGLLVARWNVGRSERTYCATP